MDRSMDRPTAHKGHRTHLEMPRQILMAITKVMIISRQATTRPPTTQLLPTTKTPAIRPPATKPEHTNMEKLLGTLVGYDGGFTPKLKYRN